MLGHSRKVLRATNSFETKGSLWRLVGAKLPSYAAAQQELGLSAIHRTGQYENNEAEVSRQHTRERDLRMRRFKSAAQVQRVLAAHAATRNAFRLARHRRKAIHYRHLRERPFNTWKTETGVHRALNCAPMRAPGPLGRKQLDNSG